MNEFINAVRAHAAAGKWGEPMTDETRAWMRDALLHGEYVLHICKQTGTREFGEVQSVYGPMTRIKVMDVQDHEHAEVRAIGWSQYEKEVMSRDLARSRRPVRMIPR